MMYNKQNDWDKWPYAGSAVTASGIDRPRFRNVSATMNENQDYRQRFADKMQAAMKEKLAANPRSTQNFLAQQEKERSRYRKLERRKPTVSG